MQKTCNEQQTQIQNTFNECMSHSLVCLPLTLIWVGFSGIRFEVQGGGGGGITPVNNLLELRYKLQIWHVNTHPYVVSNNIPVSV